MKILVCGGAGYIGSHLVREIHRGGKHSVVVVDDLGATKGLHCQVPTDVPLERGDVRDATFLDHVFTTHKPDAVVHMCGFIVVPESCKDPLMYYDNNVVGGLRMMQAMQKHGCKKFVFSSTAALFGTPKDASMAPIPPDAPIHPESPYGVTKHMTEQMLHDCDTAFGLKYVCLRYFNACGAHPDGDIGETHDPETHLIPIVLQVPLGKREKVFIMGTDYPTPDGSCVRDYIHVCDLATAHIAALEYLEKGGKSDAFNLGTGHGYSVRQVIETARKITGHPIPAEEKERRPGDPPCLVASPARAMEVLGWSPKLSKIEDIISTAWNFHQKHPNGYAGSGPCNH
jgi:UDP-glucose 4-epimerase